jgi:hypothetical protein
LDSYDGSNEDPLSLHKFLYASGNPVNRLDPSGKLPVVSDWFYGKRVHSAIEAHFMASPTVGTPIVRSAISTILGVPWIPAFTASIPDLVEMPTLRTPGQVYEIKPAGSFVQGAGQLGYYLGILNVTDPLKRRWVPGMTYQPPKVIQLNWGTYAFVMPPVAGVILYQVEDFRLTIAALAVMAIRSTEYQFEWRLSLQPALSRVAL